MATKNRRIMPRLFPWLLVVGAAVVMFLRAPGFFIEPRIWAEEGTVYMAYAYNHSFWQALLAVHQGYYALFPNLATILALYAGVEHAPVVTTWLSFGAQLLPVALIAWSNGSIWRAWYRRILGVLAVLFAASSGEVWLNSINAQFYWNIAAFLILVDDDTQPGQLRRILYNLILAVSALTGAVSCFLLPMFILKAFWEQRTDSKIQTGILGMGTILQAAAWWSSRSASLSLSARLGSLDLSALIAVIFNRTMIAPLLGQSFAALAADWLMGVRSAGGTAYALVTIAMAAAICLLLVALIWRYPRRGLLMAGSYLLVVTLSVATALVAPGDPKFVLVNPYSALRYFYGPSVMMLVLLISNVEIPAPSPRWLTWFSLALVLTGLATGIWHYRSDINQFQGKNWPHWKWEVARWRANPQHEILIWPPPWKIKLQK